MKYKRMDLVVIKNTNFKIICILAIQLPDFYHSVALCSSVFDLIVIVSNKKYYKLSNEIQIIILKA